MPFYRQTDEQQKSDRSFDKGGHYHIAIQQAYGYSPAASWTCQKLPTFLI
jgi:hypothetical protein